MLPADETIASLLLAGRLTVRCSIPQPIVVGFRSTLRHRQKMMHLFRHGFHRFCAFPTSARTLIARAPQAGAV
jgi:hypothetical protein